MDFLAVSIGTVHGRMKGEPSLDFERLQGINERLGIPLVIHGGTGTAVQGGAKFQYSWLIEFVHEKVIDSYSDDPVHVDFADKLFRPIAADRISIDYLES